MALIVCLVIKVCNRHGEEGRIRFVVAESISTSGMAVLGEDVVRRLNVVTLLEREE